MFIIATVVIDADSAFSASIHGIVTHQLILCRAACLGRFVCSVATFLPPRCMLIHVGHVRGLETISSKQRWLEHHSWTLNQASPKNYPCLATNMFVYGVHSTQQHPPEACRIFETSSDSGLKSESKFRSFAFQDSVKPQSNSCSFTSRVMSFQRNPILRKETHPTRVWEGSFLCTCISWHMGWHTILTIYIHAYIRIAVSDLWHVLAYQTIFVICM